MSVLANRRASTLGAMVSALAASALFSAGAAAQPSKLPPAPPPAQPPAKPPPAEVVVDLGTYDTSMVVHPTYALQETPTGSSAACPGDPAAYNWSRTWEKSDEFGNNTFGAGYDGKLTVMSSVGGGNQADKITVSGELRGLGTIFGHDVTMLKGSGWASLAGNVGNAQASLAVAGITVWTQSASKTLTQNKTFDETFFAADTWITLGIVPVHFSASASGQLGYHYDVHTVGNSIDLTFNPWGKAYATASASVDVFLASAGVEGTITLVEVSAPAHGVLSVYPTNVHYTVDADVVVQSLSGEIDAFAKVPGKKWTMKLVSWPPAFDASFPIIHASNCDTPTQHSVCGDNQCVGNETHANCAADCAAPPPAPPPDDDLPPVCQGQPQNCYNP